VRGEAISIVMKQFDCAPDNLPPSNYELKESEYYVQFHNTFLSITDTVMINWSGFILKVTEMFIPR
jgi:hypothetical protein